MKKKGSNGENEDEDERIWSKILKIKISEVTTAN